MRFELGANPGGSVSLLVLFCFDGPYTRAILWAAHTASSSRRNLIVLLCCLFLGPIALLLV